MIAGAFIGLIALTTARNGVLNLSGANVPVVAPGAAISVKNGTAIILAGTFAAPATPTPTPSVSPTATPTPRPSVSPTPTSTPRLPPSPFPTSSLVFCLFL
jgi:hypothetical protein